jgi:hypothetical protein
MNEQGPLAIVDQLVDAGVRLVVIGGHAVNFHGYLRATEDVDIVFERTVASEQALTKVLQEAGAYWISDEIDPRTGVEKTIPVTIDYVHRTHLMMLGSEYGYVDLFDFVPGCPGQPLDDLFASATVLDRRPFVSLAWLKRMKRAANRPQDQIDLEHLP